MKTRLFLFIVFYLVINQVTAQEQPDSYPPFQLMRAKEDYRFLSNQLPLDNFWEKIKLISLSKNSFLSLGGDVRSEFQVLQNEIWEKGNDDAALFQRFMLHSDWRFGKNVRLFGQLKSAHSVGRNGDPFFLNDDDLDFHQLFIGLNIGNSTLEVGRRELSYGSRRLVSFREGTNVRQSFDGVRWIWRRPDQQFDLLFYAYNPQQVGVFDNEINTDQLLWGGYFVWNVSATQGLNFDFYYLGVDNENPSFEQGNEEETRHSLGIRHWGKSGSLQFNNEAVFQFGKFGEGNITAWTISSETNFALSFLKTQTTIGLKTQIISGDNDPTDGDLQTFNALYPRGGYFGLLALIGPANLMDIHPSVKFAIGNNWSLNLDWDIFWRHQLGDGIYFPSGRLNIPSGGSRERFIGHQAGVQFGTSVNRFLELEASYFYFFSGAYLKEVTEGANFSQFGLSINFKF